MQKGRLSADFCSGIACVKTGVPSSWRRWFTAAIFGLLWVTEAEAALIITFDWISGDINTPVSGSITPTGLTTLNTGDILNISSNANHDFDGRAIIANGTVNWQAGAGPIRSGDGGTFTNNGSFNDAAANGANVTANFNNAFNGTGGTTFINAVGASYTKTSAGTTQFDATFNNSGTVTVSTGTLTLNGGGTLASNATIAVASGASVAFSGGSYAFAN